MIMVGLHFILLPDLVTLALWRCFLGVELTTHWGTRYFVVGVVGEREGGGCVFLTFCF